VPPATAITDLIKHAARDAGFELAGIASVRDFEELNYFPEWIAAGRAGEMKYLEARDEAGNLKRASLKHTAPWARSVIVCAINYNTAQPYSTQVRDPERGWISRYAWSREDYHDAVLRRLREVETKLREADDRTSWAEAPIDGATDGTAEAVPFQGTSANSKNVFTGASSTNVCTGASSTNACTTVEERRFSAASSAPENQGLQPPPGDHDLITRCYVDTGPLVERVYAKYAGIGWIAKNTCIINQQLGSWLFLGVILTSLELTPDLPAPDRCGTCTRCIEACPTDAIIAPYQLDSNLCISYLTIEKRGEIPEQMREGLGRHVFGCDICQDVCPWNRKAPATSAPDFQPREGLVNPALAWLAEISAEDFQKSFRGSPIRRTKRTGLRRNAIIAMGNSGHREFIPLLNKLASDEDPVVASSAGWAKEHLQGNSRGDSPKALSADPCDEQPAPASPTRGSI
jgi:epoxyqueuosine reductase QueG